VAVLVVVAHLGFLGGRGLVTGSVDGLFDNVYLLVVGRAGSRGVNGGAGDVNRLLVGGDGARGVDGVLVDVGASLEAGSEAGRVNGGAGDAGLLAVVGLEARTVLALGNVNYRVMRAVGGIELDARLGVGRTRSAVLLTVNKLFAGAGTAVMLLFTSDTDLFFSEAILSAARKSSLGLE
jgi:hypothetical protein